MEEGADNSNEKNTLESLRRLKTPVVLGPPLEHKEVTDYTQDELDAAVGLLMLEQMPVVFPIGDDNFGPPTYTNAGSKKRLDDN